jgi:two-component system, NtrC family, sensor kinase
VSEIIFRTPRLSALIGSGPNDLIPLLVLGVVLIFLVAVLFLFLQNRRILAQRQQLAESESRIRSLVQSMEDLVFLVDTEMRIATCYQGNSDKLFVPPEQFLNKKLEEIGYPERVYQAIRQTYEKVLSQGVSARVDYELYTPVGLRWFDLHASPFKDAGGLIRGLTCVIRDITDRKDAERERIEMQGRLMTASKLESIGQLAAGIAHEINNPVQYVGNNIFFVRNALADLMACLKRIEAVFTRIEVEGVSDDTRKHIRDISHTLDLIFLRQEIPRALEEAQGGIHRIADIVRAMQTFAYPDSDMKVMADLNEGLRTTVNIARNEWKNDAEVELELASDLPLIPCYPGAVNQVFTNMLINAVHAIRAKGRSASEGPKGRIRVRSVVRDGWIDISFADNGCGIPDAIRDRIFEPFFTTKAVGEGTGQGLFLAHNIIVNEHSGRITWTSELECGTTFTISLPINGKEKGSEHP